MRPESEILRLLARMAGITTALAALPGLVLAQGGLRADFNGDGFDDLAVQVAAENIGSLGNAGKVNVIYGTAGGLSATGDQIWQQDTWGIAGVAEQGDGFGYSLTAGDFDHDGFDDLAVGVPGENAGRPNAGAVNVLYGAASGLSATGNQLWYQDTLGIEGVAEVGDSFGEALATGDFNSDGFDDLAVGVPGEDIWALEGAGAVNVIYGTASGLSAAGNQIWHQDTLGIEGAADKADLFGGTLSAGDFDNDGFEDLVVGVINERVSGLPAGGAVNVIYGTVNGLSASGDQIWHQDSPGIKGEVSDTERFSFSLTTGDFDNDGFDDLAVGNNRDGVSSNPLDEAGAVNVIYGTYDGLSAIGNQIWHEDTLGIEGWAEPEDLFGESVTAGDFDMDGFDDLAVGVSQKAVGRTLRAGAVHIIYGTAGGLSATGGNQVWTQNSPGIVDTAEEYDSFGVALTVGDFDNDGFDDLTISAPGEDVVKPDAGQVHIIYGTGNGLTATGNQIWNQNTPGVEDVAETGDLFGGNYQCPC